METETVIEMDSVSKNFFETIALDNVSFNVVKGEVHGLVGENGAGKSTLIKILSGAHIKNKGSIKIFGNTVEIKNPLDSLNYGISTIYQEFHLAPNLTVAENIFLGFEEKSFVPGSIANNKTKVKTKKLLDELEININPTTYVEDLSRAEQQLIEIAKGLISNRRIYIMDEPTASLTDKEANTLYNVIKNLKNKSSSIIFVSHRIDEVVEITDRITVLKDGKLVETVVSNKTNVKEIITLMTGKEHSLKINKSKSSNNTNIAFELKGFTKKDKFHNVNMKLYEGEIIGVAGLIGVGKTELALSIFGVEKKDEGLMYIEGKEVEIKKPIDAIENSIAYVTEDRKKQGLFLDLSVRNNITMASLDQITNKLKFIRSSQEIEKSNNFVEILKIKTQSINHFIKYLSGGNQQKTVIARWLMKNAKVVIFNEPTVGIDIGSKFEIYNLINELSSNNISILIFGSETQELLRLCNRIYTMVKGGVITNEFKANEITEQKLMAAITT